MALRKSPSRESEQGQAVVEYILLVSIVVSFLFILTQALGRIGLGKKLTAPLSKSFAMAYKYGDPRAKGYDEGTPTYHPRVVGGDHNLRLFAIPDPE